MGDMKYNWALKELAFTFSGTIVVLFFARMAVLDGGTGSTGRSFLEAL